MRADQSLLGAQFDRCASIARSVFALAVLSVVVVNIVNAYSIVQEPWINDRYIWWLLESERNPGTWLSTALLLLSALLALSCAAVDADHREPFWKGSAAVLALASMEEIASVHERVDSAMGSVLSGEGERPVGWVIPALLLVAVLGVIAWRLRPRLPRRTTQLLMLGAGVFVAGAAGIEVVAAQWTTSNGKLNAGYLWLTTLEENLEYAGSLVLIYAIAQHLSALMRTEAQT